MFLIDLKFISKFLELFCMENVSFSYPHLLKLYIKYILAFPERKNENMGETQNEIDRKKKIKSFIFLLNWPCVCSQ